MVKAEHLRREVLQFLINSESWESLAPEEHPEVNKFRGQEFVSLSCSIGFSSQKHVAMGLEPFPGSLVFYSSRMNLFE